MTPKKNPAIFRSPLVHAYETDTKNGQEVAQALCRRMHRSDGITNIPAGVTCPDCKKELEAK